MSFPAPTTGVGVAAQIAVAGNQAVAAKGAPYVYLSLSATEWPTTFQLNPIIQDVKGNPVTLGTVFTVASVAADTPAPLTLTSVAASASVGGIPQAVYQGTTNASANALVGHEMIVTGFTNPLSNGTFQVVSNTTSSITLSNGVAVADSSGGTGRDQTAVAVYTGTFSGAVTGALVGQTFTVAGFTNAGNNGTFEATANSGATTLTLDNPNAIAETHAATATAQETLAIEQVTAVAANGVYTGTFPQFANVVPGSKVTIAGFTTSPTLNNGVFTVVSVTSTTLTTSNAASVAVTQAATATYSATSVLTYFSDGAAQYTNWNPTGPNTSPVTRAACVAVSATGLLTAGAKGAAVVEVSFPFANNNIGTTFAIAPNPMTGLPHDKIWREVNVVVLA